MSGTRQSGINAAKTNKEIYGDSFYKRIGAMGGSKITDKPKGFATLSREKLQLISAKGGRISKRTKKL